MSIYVLRLEATTEAGSDAFRRALAGYTKNNRSGVVRRAKVVLGSRMGFQERLYRVSEVPSVIEIENTLTGVSGSVFNSTKNFLWWQSNMIEKLDLLDKAEGIKRGVDYVFFFEERF